MFFFLFNLFTTCWQCCNLGGANCNYASAASQGAMALYQCCGKDQTGAYYCCPSQVLLVRGTLRLLRNKYLLCRWARLSTSAPSTDRSIRSAYCIASVCVASGLIIVGQCAVRPSPYPPPAPSPSKHGGGGSGGTVAGIVVSCAYLLFFKHTFGGVTLAIAQCWSFWASSVASSTAATDGIAMPPMRTDGVDCTPLDIHLFYSRDFHALLNPLPLTLLPSSIPLSYLLARS